MKKSFQLLTIGITLWASVFAAKSTLVIGCRPWDANMEGFLGEESPLFIDRWLGVDSNIPSSLPESFHHLDLDDNLKEPPEILQVVGPDGKLPPTQPEPKNFSDFADTYSNSFDTIAVHWLTEYLIDRQGPAWKNCFKILKEEGTLVIPVTKVYLGQSSQEAAEELTKILNGIGFTTENITFNENAPLDETPFQLLKRPPMVCFMHGLGNWKEMMKEHFEPIIIVAKKPAKED